MSIQLYAPGTRKGNRSWVARVSVDGRRAEVSTATTNKAAAQRWAREFERKLALEGRTPRPGEEVAFAYAAEKYLEYRDDPGGARGRAERVRVARLVAVLGRKRLSDITQADLVDAARKLYPDRAPATLNREALRPAAAILHYAESCGWCPWLRVRLFKEPKPRTRALAMEAATALIANATDPDLHRLLLWLFRQGDRISDALRVEWANIDLRAGTVEMRIGKTDEWRTADLHWELVALLGNVEVKEGRVFRWETKSGVYKPLRTLCQRLGIHMTPHMARHSMATWLVQDGVNTATIMEAGGWRDVKSVMRYGRANLAEVRAARGGLPALSGRTTNE
jgi:integrase